VTQVDFESVLAAALSSAAAGRQEIAITSKPKQNAIDLRYMD